MASLWRTQSRLRCRLAMLGLPRLTPSFGRIAARHFVGLVENRVSINPRLALLATSFLTSIALRVRMAAPLKRKERLPSSVSNTSASKVS